MSEKNERIENFEELLRKFQTLLPLKKAPKTLLEISRFPHYELACSNILAFFLDPAEEHGLGDIFLKSLLIAAECIENDPEKSLGNVKVIREDRTDSNKSIDIVVEGKDFVLGIENKIFADASYNPYTLYAETLRARGKTGCHQILLSVRKENPEGKCGFKPVTYDEVFAVLEKNIGTKILTGDQRCLAFLIDFMNTIKNLKRGTHMDLNLLNFFATNEKAVHDLYTKTLSLIKELERKGKDAKKIIVEIKPPAISDWEGKDDSASDPRTDCAYCIWCIGDLGKDQKMGIELQIRAIGWVILVWAHGEAEMAIVADFVEKSKIKFKQLDEIWIYAEYQYADDAITVARKFKEFVLLVSGKLMEFKKDRN